MAKKYEEFKRDIETHSKALEAVDTLFLAYEKSLTSLDGYRSEGIREIAVQVQKLKDIGHTGRTINDFLGDAGVKKCMDAVNQATHRLEADVAKLAPAKKQGLSHIYLLNMLISQLKLEIAARQKERTTKLGIGNKSLPEMIKLEKPAEEVRKRVSDRLNEFNRAAGYWTQETNKDIAEALAQTRGATLAQLDRDTLDKIVQPRHLGVLLSDSKKWVEAIKAAREGGEKARDAKNPNAVKNSKQQALKPLESLRDLDARIRKALQSRVVQSSINTNANKSAIEAGLKRLSDYVGEAKREAAKLASL